ncbi:MAG: YggT family protein [Clostridia bacterium]|nr:YggT family protein [Clostridia bacterium]
MNTLLYILQMTLSVLLGALELLMLGRAILSWFPMDEDNALMRFLHAMTEPVIYPVRVLLERLDLFQGLPIDMSFFFTFILISILSMMI